MKRFIAMTLISATALGVLGGCGSNSTAQNAGTDQNASQETTQDTAQGTSADTQSMSQDIQDMVKPADAILRCMVENNMDYDPEDSTFFWKALYYFAGAYAQDYPESEFDANTGALTLPRYTMRALGSVISSEYTDLPAIPAEMSANVVYDPDKDAYTLYTGDIGLAESKITSFSDNGDGTYNIVVELRGTTDDKLIAQGDFKIASNEYALDIIDAPFIYTIVSLDYKEGE